MTPERPGRSGKLRVHVSCPGITCRSRMRGRGELSAVGISRKDDSEVSDFLRARHFAAAATLHSRPITMRGPSVKRISPFAPGTVSHCHDSGRGRRHCGADG